MYVPEALQSLINRAAAPALLGALGVALLLLIVACGLLLEGRYKWIGLGLGLFAIGASTVVLLIVDAQTVSFRQGESVTVTRPRHSERVRTFARAGMVGIPAAFGLAGLGSWISAQRRQRRSVPTLLKAARAHLFLGEQGPALAEFNRAIRIAPYLADAYLGRGLTHLALGEVEAALADFDQALQCDPRMVQAYIQRAKLRTEAGDCEGALSDLSRVMDIHPTDPELYLHRGICRYKKGLLDDAAADFHRVLKLTNHTDFAEPAKEFLRLIESPEPSLQPPDARPALDAHAAPDANAAPAAEANGLAELAAPESQAEDSIP